MQRFTLSIVFLSVLALPALGWAQGSKSKSGKVTWVESELEIELTGLHESEPFVLARYDLASGKKSWSVFLYELSLADEWMLAQEKAGRLESSLEAIDKALERCASIDESSDEGAKKAERCRRAAYPEEFLYWNEVGGAASVYLAIFDVSGKSPKLLKKVKIQEMATALDASQPASAADWDGDGRVELGVTFRHQEPGSEERNRVELRIVDLETGTVQLSTRLEERWSLEDDTMSSETGVWTLQDLDGDAQPDLVIQVIKAKGLCYLDGSQWLMPAGIQGEGCQVELEQRVLFYDSSADQWGEQSSGSKKYPPFP